MTVAGKVRHAWFVHFNFQFTDYYVWQGLTKRTIGGHVWFPVGPRATLDQVDDVASDNIPSITLKVSGVDSSLLTIALGESAEVQRRLATIYDLYFDEDWQPISSLAVFAVVRMDTIKVVNQRNKDGSRSQAIQLTCEQFLSNGPNPPFGRYSNTDQWARQGNDNDLYFEFMGQNQNRRQRWPTY